MSRRLPVHCIVSELVNYIGDDILKIKRALSDGQYIRPFADPRKGLSHTRVTTGGAGRPCTAAASDSRRPNGAESPPWNLSSCSSRPTFKPAVATHRGYESHNMCQLVDQPTTADRPVDTFGCLLKVELERSRTVSVDQRNAPRRPTAPLVAALPHGHQVAMRPARPHRHLLAAVAARPVAISGRQWPAGST